MSLTAPFPYFGGKRAIARDVWARLGSPRQYIEPFCGSAAMLLAAPTPAALEVVGDMNGFIANFWRAVKHQPDQVALHADYPASHIDLGARHGWLMAQRERLGAEMQDPNWPGDAKVAGWWLWGQCSWIGSGWCDWGRIGKVPHASDAGMGVQAIGKVPHASDAADVYDDLLTSSGRAAWHWLHKLANRLERVRIFHGDWSRCLNSHFGGDDTAVFLDPPYLGYEHTYGGASGQAAAEARLWALENPSLRVALAGLLGDYDLPGWEAVQWSRGRLTYSGGATTDNECIWYSPGCVKPSDQLSLFEFGSAHDDHSRAG